MEKEIWKDIPDYEGIYQASNIGRIKALDKIIKSKGKGTRFIGEKIIKGFVLNTGYVMIGLSKKGILERKTAHQWIAKTFLNHNPIGYDLVINHKNFIKTDNRVCNLEIVTARENTNKKHLKSSSKHVGVYFSKNSKKWISQITINKKIIYLGSFTNELEASEAYKKALENNEINKPKINIMQNNLSKVRESKGISRYKMATDLKMIYQTLINWEKSNKLTPDKMKICADYLQTDINEIFKL